MYYKVIKNREEVYTIIKDALDPIEKWKELPHCIIYYYYYLNSFRIKKYMEFVMDMESTKDRL